MQGVRDAAPSELQAGDAVTVRVRYPTRIGDVIMTNVIRIDKADASQPFGTLRVVDADGGVTMVCTPIALKVWP